MWYWEEIITCFTTLTATCSFYVGVCVYSIFSSSFLYTFMCLLVFNKKNKNKNWRYLMLSSYFTSVICDIEKGFITCSATITAAYSFGFVLWVYSIVTLPIPYIICLCVCLTKKKKKKKKRKKRKTLSVVKSSNISNVWYWEGVYHLLCNPNCSM